MTRLLIALAALLVLLVLGESTLRQNQRQTRAQTSQLRLLAALPVADVTQIEIRAAGRSWPRCGRCRLVALSAVTGCGGG